ncbi:MAG: hypothetical protein GQF41_1967 [Candidatus Rifleibacterium amylolyticum]|nr:MAG: hypothetical protein GQF41_1967 [Candidatus Rifleibacterium amylolyticum]
MLDYFMAQAYNKNVLSQCTQQPLQPAGHNPLLRQYKNQHMAENKIL